MKIITASLTRNSTFGQNFPTQHIVMKKSGRYQKAQKSKNEYIFKVQILRTKYFKI